jgi:hypothetical protein
MAGKSVGIPIFFLPDCRYSSSTIAWAPSSGTATSRTKNCMDKIFFITALPSSFLVSQTQITLYAHCIPSYVAIAKFSLPFFQP